MVNGVSPSGCMFQAAVVIGGSRHMHTRIHTYIHTYIHTCAQTHTDVLIAYVFRFSMYTYMSVVRTARRSPQQLAQKRNFERVLQEAKNTLGGEHLILLGLFGAESNKLCEVSCKNVDIRSCFHHRGHSLRSAGII